MTTPTLPRSGTRTPCDFCDGTRAEWRHPCRPFAVVLYDGALLASDRPWMACRDCHALIRVNNWRGLLDHSMSRFRTIPSYRPEHEAMCRTELSVMWSGFRTHRTGNPTRIGRTEEGR